MTIHKPLLIAIVGAAAAVACRHASTTSAPPPAVMASQTPTTGVPTGTPRPRPPRLSVDSLTKLRRIMANQVLASIAGRENEPAGTVFKNVQVSKDMPAGKLVNMMDSTYGRSMGWECSHCHVTTDFSSDTKHDKGFAKQMQIMVNVINAEYVPKINSKDPQKVDCMMCHRGTNIPNDTLENYRIPPRRPPG